MLEVSNLKKAYSTGILNKQMHLAVDDVNFTIGKKEIFGLVGESGCGKTTVGKLLLRLMKPEAGEIVFNGINIINLNRSEMRKIRLKMQILFQDAESSLNPKMKIKDIVAEPLRLHNLVSALEIEKKVIELLKIVGLNEDHLNRYPHELSGGQNQRIALARVLSMEPEFIVADEPTSALDVSVQAQILHLYKKMQNKFGFSSLFISHDLGVMRNMTDRIGIMYLGKIIEIGKTEIIFNNPKHPYTQTLISCVKTSFKSKNNAVIFDEQKLDETKKNTGCNFCMYCLQKIDLCEKIEPKMIELKDERTIACHLF